MMKSGKGLCAGRVVLVTGGGRGMGRAHALVLAREGAKLVVNDLGCEIDGTGSSPEPAASVVEEIRAAGGEAVANTDDVADWEGARRAVEAGIDAFGRLDVLVASAGILRDRSLVSLDVDDWDAVMRTNLKGLFCPARHAAAHWRERSRAGEEVDARIIATTSMAGLWATFGQANYVVANAAVAGFASIASEELERYGVTVNTICPGGRTRQTEPFTPALPANAPFDLYDPEHGARFVAWLSSKASAHVNGYVFNCYGGRLRIETGWRPGPTALTGGPLQPSAIGAVVNELLEKAPPVRWYTDIEPSNDADPSN